MNKIARGIFTHSSSWNRQLIPSTPSASFKLSETVAHSKFGISNRVKTQYSFLSQYSTSSQFTKEFLFRQLFDRESCTYTYLLADNIQNVAVLIDPVITLAERDSQLIKELGLQLQYVLNTHVHADHISGTGILKKLIPGSKSVISKASGAKADVLVAPGDEIKFGHHKLKVVPTPGHTNGCVTYVCHEQSILFTGDTLIVRGCGRTDFQEGDSSTLYDSVHHNLFSLPDSFKVFPAHDYKGQTMTTIGEEKKYNPRLTKPKDEFINIMKNLNLAYPKMIDKAVPANLVCGIHEIPKEL